MGSVSPNSSRAVHRRRRCRRWNRARPTAPARAAFGSDLAPEDRRAFAEEGIGIGEVRLPMEDWLKEAAGDANGIWDPFEIHLESMEFRAKDGDPKGSRWSYMDWCLIWIQRLVGWRRKWTLYEIVMNWSFWGVQVVPRWRVGLFQCLSVWRKTTKKLLWSAQCVHSCQVTLHSAMADDVMQKFGHVPQQALDLDGSSWIPEIRDVRYVRS